MKKKIVPLLLLVFIVSSIAFFACGEKKLKKPQKIYVAWSNDQNSYSYISTLKTIEAMGAEAIVLDQVLSVDLSYDQNKKLINATDDKGILTKEVAKLVKVNTWQNSNVNEVMKDVSCIVFPGGVDICPTLYYEEENWHGIEEDTNYSAERDVSDYLLLSYCLEKDIPMFCICRGMQMLSIVSGAEMIQDISEWNEEKDVDTFILHRDPEKKKFMAHDVEVVSKESLLYQIVGDDKIEKVPSWHHQAVKSVDNTRLTVTAYSGEENRIIESVERRDKTFCIGVQFHPEVAVRKEIDKELDAKEFMEKDIALAFFRALVDIKR